MTMAQRKKTKKIVLTIIMLILALIYIYPVFLMAINSVKPFGEVIMDVIALPSKIEWSKLHLCNGQNEVWQAVP